MKPRIGLTMFWEANPPERENLYGPWKFTLNQSYMRLFRDLDAVPLGILPGTGRPASEQVGELHGLVMTGGRDPAPALFHREDRGSRNPETDRPLWDMEVYRAAREAGLPVLAVCLGMQLAGIVQGTTLIQDIPSAVPGALDHQGGLHEVETVLGTPLRRQLGGKCMVWSSHHQALEEVPSDYREAARSSDGVLEAMVSLDGLVTAVQWHPERDGTCGPLAENLVIAARGKM